MDSIFDYFPNLSIKQQKQFKVLLTLYTDWNKKINVISRKDMNAFYIRHVLHSLGIAKVITFKPGTRILDVGTGGGFPGIPLAIMFPEVQFALIDSIGKKVKVVNEVSKMLNLKNVSTHHIRAEYFSENVDFVVSRAVTQMKSFVPWVNNKISLESNNKIKNGILYLKGGNITEELKFFPKAKIHDLKNYFDNPFFETKKVVYIPI